MNARHIARALLSLFIAAIAIVGALSAVSVSAQQTYIYSDYEGSVTISSTGSDCNLNFISGYFRVTTSDGNYVQAPMSMRVNGVTKADRLYAVNSGVLYSFDASVSAVQCWGTYEWYDRDTDEFIGGGTYGTPPTATPSPTYTPAATQTPAPTATPAAPQYYLVNANADGSNTTKHVWWDMGGAGTGECVGLTATVFQTFFSGEIRITCLNVGYDPPPVGMVGWAWDVHINSGSGDRALSLATSYGSTKATFDLENKSFTDFRYCVNNTGGAVSSAIATALNCEPKGSHYSQNSAIVHSVPDRFGIWAGHGGKGSVTLDTLWWIVYGIPPEPPVEPPPPSDFSLSCGLPVISGTETITETIYANLLTNGSFESDLSGWTTGTGDYSAETYEFASDGTAVLSMPGTGAASVCQPWTVPTSTAHIDHFTGGFDTRAAGDGTGQHNIDLVFRRNITAQIANGFVHPSDTLTWTVNHAGQNLPGGTSGQLCIVGDGGDVSAYVDRVYIHARDTFSGVVCIDPSTIITTTPTPTPTPTPIPTSTPSPPDNFPVPDIGGDGACYNCVLPTNILSFGQWIRWLLCGLNNLFYCYLYIWLLSLAGYASAGLQYIQAFYVWLPTVLTAMSDWMILSLNGLSAFMFAMLNALSGWMEAGLEAMSGQMVNMLNASSSLLVSVIQDVSDWFTASLQNLSDWFVAALTGLSVLMVSMLTAGSTWLTSSLQALADWFTGTLTGWYEWILATVTTVTTWGESAMYWLYSLLAGAVNTAINSLLGMLGSVLASLIASGAMIAEYAAAAWELIALYFSMLQQIAAAVVDLLDIIWRMTVGVLTAFTTDEATSVELFGYNIDNMQQPNGINDASLFYWMVLGFMLADAAITSIPLMRVFIYTVMGLMSYGVILWTLRRGTKMLPIS